MVGPQAETETLLGGRFGGSPAVGVSRVRGNGTLSTPAALAGASFYPRTPNPTPPEAGAGCPAPHVFLDEGMIRFRCMMSRGILQSCGSPIPGLRDWPRLQA